MKNNNKLTLKALKEELELIKKTNAAKSNKFQDKLQQKEENCVKLKLKLKLKLYIIYFYLGGNN